MPRINLERKRRKAGGKPFPKGVSGNPTGRRKTPLVVRVIEIDVRRYAREMAGREAVDTLIEVMRGRLVVDIGTVEEPKPTIVPVGAATRVAAAEALLDRGYGRPPQAVEIAGKDGGPIITVSSAYDIICSRLDSLAARLEEGEAKRDLRALLTDEQLAELAYDWRFWGRPEQQLPAGDWFVWLVMTGRGWGKTRTAVENIARLLRGSTPFTAPPDAPGLISIVADTSFDLRQYSIEGPSGFLNVGPPDFRPKYHPSQMTLEWPNGCRALLFSAEDPR